MAKAHANMHASCILINCQTSFSHQPMQLNLNVWYDGSSSSFLNLRPFSFTKCHFRSKGPLAVHASCLFGATASELLALARAKSVVSGQESWMKGGHSAAATGVPWVSGSYLANVEAV